MFREGGNIRAWAAATAATILISTIPAASADSAEANARPACGSSISACGGRINANGAYMVTCGPHPARNAIRRDAA